MLSVLLEELISLYEGFCTMYTQCVNPNCGVETDQLCIKCNRPFCHNCAKYRQCPTCKDPSPARRTTNKLTLRKNKRKLPPDDQPSHPSQPQQQPSPTPSSSGSSKQSSQSQHSSSDSLKKCEKCDAKVNFLKNHLDRHSVCARYYMAKMSLDSVKEVMDKINQANKNEKRKQRRRTDRENGYARNRGMDIEQQRVRRASDNSYIGCFNKFRKSLENMQNIPCVLCENTFSTGIKKITEENMQIRRLLENEERRMEQHCYDGSLWICNNCMKMATTLQGRQNLIECISDILNPDHDTSKTISLLRFVTKENLSSEVFFPVIKDEQEFECDWVNLVESPTKAMIPKSFCKLVSSEDIHVECAQLFANQREVYADLLLSVLYKDTNQKMLSAERAMKKDDFKLGFVVDNTLHIKEDNTSDDDYFLKDIRGTEAYQNKLVKDNLAKQRQNGKQNLFFDMNVYSPDDIAGDLAKILLQKHNIPVQVSVLTGADGFETDNFLVPCQVETDVHCNVYDCDRIHQSAAQKLKEVHPTGVPVTELLVVCRYIKEVVESYVNNVIAKQAQDHDLYLVFLRNGKVYLRGNVWVTELNQYNENCVILTDKTVLPQWMSNDAFELLDDFRRWELFGEIDNISEETAEKIDTDHFDCLREGSLLEMIYVSARGLKNHWSSQSVEKVDVRENPLQLFRRKRQEGEENEEEFLDTKGQTWVLVLTWRRKYVLKPAPVQHITLGQLSEHYKKLDNRTKNIGQLREELENNNGVILSDRNIPLYTNLDKFPNELKYLPEMILLKNKMILKLKEKTSVIRVTGNLDHCGMAVLCEPFENEDEEVEMPALEILEQRLKMMYPYYSD